MLNSSKPHYTFDEDVDIEDLDEDELFPRSTQDKSIYSLDWAKDLIDLNGNDIPMIGFKLYVQRPT
jgi:hypothetical protein